MIATTKDLSRQEYELIRRLVYAKSGINLGDHKMQLVRSRLGKRLREGGFKSFRDYYSHVQQDSTGVELCALLDAISTNTTHLYREARHFDLLQQVIAQWLGDKSWRARYSTLRIWSAACSSGEEPHSIAMAAHDALQADPGVELKILATDISTRMLARARMALYDTHRVGTVPPKLRNRYLTRVNHEGQIYLQVAPELQRTITLARFNLMAQTFPFRHGLNVVFCRNVMIYFDRATQETLVNKIAQHMVKGGYLMIGHSESLNAVEHPLSYVEPSVYRKD